MRCFGGGDVTLEKDDEGPSCNCLESFGKAVGKDHPQFTRVAAVLLLTFIATPAAASSMRRLVC